MKNSEKAFEEWFFSMPINKGKTKEHSDYACENSVWNKSWSEAIEFSAKVCREKKNQIGKPAQFALGAEQCEIEIRKQGAE